MLQSVRMHRSANSGEGRTESEESKRICVRAVRWEQQSSLMESRAGVYLHGAARGARSHPLAVPTCWKSEPLHHWDWSEECWAVPDLQASEERRPGGVLRLLRPPLTIRKLAQCSKQQRQQIRGSGCPGSPGKARVGSWWIPVFPSAGSAVAAFSYSVLKSGEGAGMSLCKTITQIHVMVSQWVSLWSFC